MSTVTDNASLPPELQAQTPIWELTDAGSMTHQPTATRVFSDGRIYEYSRLRRIETPAGLPSRVEAPPAWRLIARISPEGVKQIDAALAGAALGALPDHVGRAVPDGPRMVYRFPREGKVRSVELLGDAAINPPDAIGQVQRLIEQHTIPGGVPLAN